MPTVSATLKKLVKFLEKNRAKVMSPLKKISIFRKKNLFLYAAEYVVGGISGGVKWPEFLFRCTIFAEE